MNKTEQVNPVANGGMTIGAICNPEEFARNLELDFSSMVRKKGSIDYLPWAEIVRTLHKCVPFCTYGFMDGRDGSIIHYTPINEGYLRPYLTRVNPETGAVVTTPPGFFPISNMAARHKAITNPDIRAIDNCLRRAIAKEIGIHTGIGLHLWAASDPFDEVDDDAVNFSGSAKPSRTVSKASTSPSTSPGTTTEDLRAKLLEACDKSGLDEHGRQTIAKVLGADDIINIPATQILKIMQLLSVKDNVLLFNAGKNTKGKTVNPKTPEQETRELVEAFKKSET